MEIPTLTLTLTYPTPDPWRVLNPLTIPRSGLWGLVLWVFLAIDVSERGGGQMQGVVTGFFWAGVLGGLLEGYGAHQ